MLVTDFPKNIKYYLNSDKEVNWGEGEAIGLSNNAIMDKFKYTCYEVELDLIVHEDGKAKSPVEV